MSDKILVPDISVFNMTQGQIETFAQNVQQAIEVGDLDPIQVYGTTKAMERMVKAVQAKVKDNAEMAVRALLPADKKSIDIGNFTFTSTKTKVYSIETTSEVLQMEKNLKAIAAEIAEFKTLAKTTGVAMTHPVFGLVKPAVLETETPGISVKIRK